MAPNNASAWNYLRGVLDSTQTPYSTLRIFVEPYTTTPLDDTEVEAEVIDLENPLPSRGADLPCVAAIEFLADIHAKETGGLEHAVKVDTTHQVYISVTNTRTALQVIG